MSGAAKTPPAYTTRAPKTQKQAADPSRAARLPARAVVPVKRIDLLVFGLWESAEVLCPWRR
jgi:hypothetical protein